jgi:hypothetical protein
VRFAANTSSAAWSNSRDLPARTNASADAEEDAADEDAVRDAASEADSPPRAGSPETHRREPASARGRTPPRVSHAAALAEHAPLAADARVRLARPPASAIRTARRNIRALRARDTDDERVVLRQNHTVHGSDVFGRSAREAWRCRT